MQRPSGNIDAQGSGADMEDKHYHPATREAKKIKLTDQPWYRPGVTRKQSDEYLASTPPGAFVVRPAAAGDSHVMDVQAGPRIGHVLLTHVTEDGLTYFHLPGTPHFFEHVYDLVMFCHYNPFIFEKIDGQIIITLSIAMAKKAEKINIKRKKQKDVEEKEAEKVNEQRKADEAMEAKLAQEDAARKAAEAEKARIKAEEEAEKARKKAQEEAARKAAEEEMARKKAEEEAARKKIEEEKRREREEKAAREAEAKAAREAEQRAKFEEEARARREAEEKRREEEERARREAEEKKRIEDEKRREATEAARKEAEAKRKLAEDKERATREAEELARRDFEAKARRKSEAALRLADQEHDRLLAIEQARLAEQEREAEERAARLDAMRKQREERDAEEARRRREEDSRLLEERQALAAVRRGSPGDIRPVTNDMSDLFRSRFVASKRPGHLKKVKAEIKHPYHIHECALCPGGRCEEGFKYNKFKTSKCGNCSHTHDLRDPPPPEAAALPPPPPPAKEEKKASIGMRFFPGGKGSKIAELTGQLQGPEATAIIAAAAAVKKKQKDDKKEKDGKKKRNTSDLRQRVGQNTSFGLEDVMDNPFKDPYLLVPVEEPHDENHTAVAARTELELRLIASAFSSTGGVPSKKAVEENLARLDLLESQLNTEASFHETNDDGILEAMSRTNPGAYQAIMEEQAERRKVQEDTIARMREQISEMRLKFGSRT